MPTTYDSGGRPAVFLDRDGTIIEDRGDLRSPSDVAFIAGALPALGKLSHTYSLFIVTNQSGVGAGQLCLEDVERVNAHVADCLAQAGVELVKVYVCPHTGEDGCACRKPQPHFLREAAAAYGVDLSRSFVVGDHPSDVELARNAGARGVYVLTGHGSKHHGELPPECFVADDIGGAVAWILQQGG